MQPDTIVRSALGPPINLGTLYDACSERSCNLSFLKESPPPANYINSTEIPNTESEYVHVKSARDKFHLFNVTADLQASLLAGMVDLRGSGKYLQAEKSSARSVFVSFVLKTTTKHENLSILDEKFREVINVDALKHRSATHVVTGITWGANLIVTAEYKNEEKKDAQVVAGNLQATITKLLQGGSNLTSAEDTETSKFELKIVGDVLVPGQFPQTIEGAIALVGELPKLTKEYNNGKGVPVRYELTSLECIQSYFGVGVKVENLFHHLQNHTILRVTEVFDEISEAKLMLNDFWNDVKKFQAHLPETTLDQVKKLQRETNVAETKLREQLQTLLVAVRTGKAAVSKLDDLRWEYESEPYSSRNVLRTLNQDFHNVQLKIEELQGFATLGVAIVPKHTRYLPIKLLEFKGKQVFVLFGKSEAIAMDNGQLWGEHLTLLRKFAEHPVVTKNSAFLFVDLDSTPHLTPYGLGDQQRKICLQRFDRHGECVDNDLFKAKKQVALILRAASGLAGIEDAPSSSES